MKFRMKTTVWIYRVGMKTLSCTAGRAFILFAVFGLLQLSGIAEAQTFFSAMNSVPNKVWADPVYSVDGRLVGLNVVESDVHDLPGGVAFAWQTANGMKLMADPSGSGLAYVFVDQNDLGRAEVDPLAGIPQYYAPDTGQYFMVCAFIAEVMYPDRLCVYEGYAFQVVATLDGARCYEHTYQDECDQYRDLALAGADSTFPVHHVEGTPSVLSLKNETIDQHQ